MGEAIKFWLAKDLVSIAIISGVFALILSAAVTKVLLENLRQRFKK